MLHILLISSVQNVDLISSKLLNNIFEASHISSKHMKKQWFTLCEKFLKDILQGSIAHASTRDVLPRIHQKVSSENFNAKTCQHSVNDYFNNELVGYGEVCRSEFIFGRSSKVNMSIGTFCIPMNFIQHHTHMGANIKLAVDKRFHLSFSFTLFRLHGGPVCRKDLVHLRNINLHEKASYLFCGYKDPWVLIYSYYAIGTHIVIKYLNISIFSFMYQTKDADLYDNFIMCLSFDCKDPLSCMFIETLSRKNLQDPFEHIFRGNPLSSNILVTYRFIRKGRQKLIYRLFVKRYQNILIHKQTGYYAEIYDGPSIEQRKVIMKESQTVLGSFVCTAVVDKKHQKQNEDKMKLIYFGVVENMQHVAIDGQESEVVQFPQICTEDSSVVHCKLFIPVARPTYWNISIDNIRYVRIYLLLLKGKE